MRVILSDSPSFKSYSRWEAVVVNRVPRQGCALLCPGKWRIVHDATSLFTCSQHNRGSSHYK